MTSSGSSSVVYVSVLPDLVDFTDEEGYGKYLDLHEVYDHYLNLKQIEVQLYSLDVSPPYACMERAGNEANSHIRALLYFSGGHCF